MVTIITTRMTGGRNERGPAREMMVMMMMMMMMMATMILSRNKQGPAHTLEPTIKVELTLDGTDCHTFCFAHNDSLHTAQLHTKID